MEQKVDYFAGGVGIEEEKRRRKKNGDLFISKIPDESFRIVDKPPGIVTALLYTVAAMDAFYRINCDPVGTVLKYGAIGSGHRTDHYTSVTADTFIVCKDNPCFYFFHVS